jgi:hypothetical protein
MVAWIAINLRLNPSPAPRAHDLVCGPLLRRGRDFTAFTPVVRVRVH